MHNALKYCFTLHISFFRLSNTCHFVICQKQKITLSFVNEKLFQKSFCFSHVPVTEVHTIVSLKARQKRNIILGSSVQVSAYCRSTAIQKAPAVSSHLSFNPNLTLNPPITTKRHVHTTLIRMRSRLTWRLTKIHAV